ncbi:iojap-like protein [Gloeothece citriformis PCC 7424]|uniref:Ribosomal silencing factor RsfS n=1 Tax=Gloeothece citriformis (strain PCC 7424) TaxID=65393 RepID=B7KCB2_GLOC7|nr:ribosome silencing factor [Gloeothece citriformis]ACK70217.1 iojap-like protein [Gloeothece citriformis PCC 7424]
MTNSENYHNNNLLTLPLPTSEAEQKTNRLVRTILTAADDRKAADIVALDVSEVSYLTDYFIIVTGFSRTQVKAISDAIEEKVAKECHKDPSRTEGKSEGSWILQDYGDAIVHIFLPEEREFYNLEAFWSHAKRFDLSQIDLLSE